MNEHWLTVLLVVHAAATWWMVGLIWFVQVVHYPLMAMVPAEQGAGYARLHQQRTTWVVGPPMLLELSSSLALCFFASTPGFWHVASWTGLSLVVLIWMWTFAVVVPVHARLPSGPTPALVASLVRRNWPRTVLWSCRGFLAAWMLLMSPG